MMRLMIHGEVALDALEEFCEGRKRNTSPRPRRSRITTRLKRELEAKGASELPPELELRSLAAGEAVSRVACDAHQKCCVVRAAAISTSKSIGQAIPTPQHPHIIKPSHHKN